jgi:hypothetical protein
VPRAADELGRALAVVVGVLELHAVVQDRPVRTRHAFVRPPDAPGVDEQLPPHAPLELHVGVARHHAALLDVAQQARELLVRRQLGDDRGVVERRRVHVERVVEHDRERQRDEPLDLLSV